MYQVVLPTHWPKLASKHYTTKLNEHLKKSTAAPVTLTYREVELEAHPTHSGSGARQAEFTQYPGIMQSTSRRPSVSQHSGRTHELKRASDIYDQVCIATQFIGALRLASALIWITHPVLNQQAAARQSLPDVCFEGYSCEVYEVIHIHHTTHDM